MKVMSYSVIDPILALADTVAGLPIQESTMYAKIGEHGLLEDYLNRKGFVFYPPTEVDVEDSFSEFSIVVLPSSKHKIDLQNGQLIIEYRSLEPSLN